MNESSRSENMLTACRSYRTIYWTAIEPGNPSMMHTASSLSKPPANGGVSLDVAAGIFADF